MSAVISFINAHDGCSVVRTLPSGRILVRSLCVDASGHTHPVTEEIEATMRAARDWLGY